MGSHTFVFAGLVIALRFKYKRMLNRQKQRKIRAVQATSGLNHEGMAGSNATITKEDSTSKTIEKCNPSPAHALTTATTSGPVYAHRSQGCGRPGLKRLTCYGDIEEELEMRYQAFSILSWIVPLYIVLIQFWGGIALGWFISARHPSIPAENHINPWWSGIFLSASGFNNSGMSLIDSNMVPFQLSYFVLLTVSALILLGNTIFPIFLRIIIQCLARVISGGDKWRGWRNGLRLLIDEDSRILCPYLFTRSELFWLAGTILIFNGIDWVSLTNRHESYNVPVINIGYLKGGIRIFCRTEPNIQGFSSISPSSRRSIPSVRRQKRWICCRRHFFFENRRSSNLRAHVSFFFTAVQIDIKLILVGCIFLRFPSLLIMSGIRKCLRLALCLAVRNSARKTSCPSTVEIRNLPSSSVNSAELLQLMIFGTYHTSVIFLLATN